MEVLVALVILAVALGALTVSAGQHVGNLTHLRDRVLAHWVAMNVITERQVMADWPETGTRRGDENMAGQDWRWRLVVSRTPETSVRRLTVTVYPQSDEESFPLADLEGYLGAPVE